MSACAVDRARTRPLIALVCRTPLVAEALTATVGEIGDVIRLPGGVRDLPGLVDAVGADAVVADSDEDAFALTNEPPRILLRVCPFQSDVRVLRDGGWSAAAPGASAETIRNLLARELVALRRWS
jgi:hypothetical protein